MVAGYIPRRLERGCNMTHAIYTAAKDGKVIAQRDALIWVRLTAPGMPSAEKRTARAF